VGVTISFSSVEVTIKAPSEFAVKRGRYIWVFQNSMFMKLSDDSQIRL
jgi:hypothetical protein